MQGWKTYAGAAVIALSAALSFLGYGTYAETLALLGGALGLTGLRAKMGRDTPEA